MVRKKVNHLIVCVLEGWYTFKTIKRILATKIQWIVKANRFEIKKLFCILIRFKILKLIVFFFFTRIEIYLGISKVLFKHFVFIIKHKRFLFVKWMFSLSLFSKKKKETCSFFTFLKRSHSEQNYVFRVFWNVAPPPTFSRSCLYTTENLLAKKKKISSWKIHDTPFAARHPVYQHKNVPIGLRSSVTAFVLSVVHGEHSKTTLHRASSYLPRWFTVYLHSDTGNPYRWLKRCWSFSGNPSAENDLIKWPTTPPPWHTSGRSCTSITTT